MHVNFFVHPSEAMALDTPELKYRKYDTSRTTCAVAHVFVAKRSCIEKDTSRRHS
jgi:hypothetical protein